MLPPLVSIIIINYNYGMFIERCLQSVFEQTFSRIECIIVDNNSTDDSRQIIEKTIKDSTGTSTARSITCLWLDDNLHITKGCMRGFSVATGDFIIFLDADDYLHPACCEAHVAAHWMLRRPVGVSSVDAYQSTGNGIVSTSTPSFSNYVLSGRGRLQTVTRPLATCDAEGILGAGKIPIAESQIHYVAREVASEWVWSPTSALCFRREAVEMMFRHAPDLVANVDAYLVRGISCLTGSVLIDVPLMVYRHHDSNIFAKRPPLSNFRSYELDQLRREDRAVGDAIIVNLLKNAELLAKRLDHYDFFIQAVEIIANAGSDTILSRNMNFMYDFIDTNKILLRKSFGPLVVARWLKSYALQRAWRYLSGSSPKKRRACP